MDVQQGNFILSSALYSPEKARKKNKNNRTRTQIRKKKKKNKKKVLEQKMLLSGDLVKNNIDYGRMKKK
jgi:hypothetical protein